jgi:hypothetical protein
MGAPLRTSTPVPFVNDEAVPYDALPQRVANVQTQIDDIHLATQAKAELR